MFFPIKCPICNAELLRTHFYGLVSRAFCASGHYALVISSSGYADERFIIGKYELFNILENGSLRCEIYSNLVDVVNLYVMATLDNTYLSPYKMNEKKIKTYIVFS